MLNLDNEERKGVIESIEIVNIWPNQKLLILRSIYIRTSTEKKR